MGGFSIVPAVTGVSNFTIETTMMTPSSAFDCHNEQCRPAVGGYCAFVPNTTQWWCCRAEDTECWSPPKPCNGTSVDTMVRCGANVLQNWCCSKEYEQCPTGIIRACAPRGFQNPALRSPALSKVSSFPVSFVGPTTPPKPARSTLVRGIVAIVVGVGLGVALMAAVAYALWRQRHRVRKRRVRRAGAKPVEVSAETGRTEMPENAVAVLHEMEGTRPVEIMSEERAELSAGECAVEVV